MQTDKQLNPPRLGDWLKITSEQTKMKNSSPGGWVHSNGVIFYTLFNTLMRGITPSSLTFDIIHLFIEQLSR